MEDQPTPPVPIPAAIAAVLQTTPPAAQAETEQPGSVLAERHLQYADKFCAWMKGLNRKDFMQAKRLLDQMMYLYAKHAMKIHSPPAREEGQDVSGTTRDGQTPSDLPSQKPGD